MGKILSALKIGDLMMETDLTWQATGIFVVLIAPIVNCPEPVEIPVKQPEPSFSRAQAYSSEVKNFLREAENWRRKQQ